MKTSDKQILIENLYFQCFVSKDGQFKFSYLKKLRLELFSENQKMVNNEIWTITLHYIN